MSRAGSGGEALREPVLGEAAPRLWCATLTPFREDRSGHPGVDLDRVRAHVAGLRRRGVDGFLATGTTGEFLYLRPAEKALVHRATLEAAQGLPVIACVFDPDPGIMVDLARRAEELGAFAVLSPPPVYQPVGPEDILDWYLRLRRAVHIPVFAYHHPRTHNPIDFPLLERLVEAGVAGMKDSSGDVGRVRLLAQVFPRRILVGGDELLGQGPLLGPIGGQMSGLANLAPELCRRLVERRGGPLELQALAAERDELRARLAEAGGLAAMKAALGMGRRAPVRQVDDEKVKALGERLAGGGGR